MIHLVPVSPWDDEAHAKRNVDCLVSPHRVFQHQLERIKAETDLRNDNMSVALWPHWLSRVGQPHLESLVYYFLQQKFDVILPLGD